MEKRLTLVIAAALLAVIGLLPVLAMVGSSFYISGSFSLKAYQTLLASSHEYALLLGRSVLLSFLASALATVVGVPLGVLIGKTDLPWRGTFAVLFTVPLLIPPYLTAVAWGTVVGKGGWISQALPPATSDILSTAFFGLPGCTGVLFTALMPIVMLLTITYVGAVNPRLEEAGRLVSRWPNVLRRITLPLIAPAILFAAILVFLLAFGEVGVPTYLRYPVYPVEILTQFAAFYDFGAATAAAIPMLSSHWRSWPLNIVCCTARSWSSRRLCQGARRTQITLGHWRLPVFGIVLGWALLTVVLPLAVLLIQSASPSAYIEAFSRASDSIVRSIAFAVIGATALALLGFFCGYLIHNRALPLWRSVDATGTVSLYIAWNGHRYRTYQFVEYANDQRHLWQPGDPDPGLSGSIYSAPHADYGCDPGTYSTFPRTRRAALRRKLVHEPAAHRGAFSKTRPDRRMAHQLRVLPARHWYQHRRLSAGL